MNFIEYNQSREDESSNPNLSKIISRVSQVKASEEVGVKYMQKWEEEAIIRAEGKAEGFEEGIEKGIQKGIEKGKENTILNNITQLMNNLKLTSDQAMEALGIPKSDYKKYADKL